MRPINVVGIVLLVFGVGFGTGLAAGMTALASQLRDAQQLYRDKADEATRYKTQVVNLQTENVLLRAGVK